MADSETETNIVSQINPQDITSETIPISQSTVPSVEPIVEKTTDTVIQSAIEIVKPQSTSLDQPKTNQIKKEFFIDDGVLTKYIGDSNDIVVPNGVRVIEENAFLWSKSFHSITIPDSVERIGTKSFDDCSNLVNIIVDKNNPKYKDVDGNLYTKDGNTLVRYATGKPDSSFVIPDSVTNIGERAFYGGVNLTRVIMGNHIKNIEKWSFGGCSKLMDITIPISLTRISDWMFCNCTSLTSVAIPDNITSIGNNAFYGCTHLANVEMGDGVEIIGDSAFYKCTNLQILLLRDGVTSIGEQTFSYCEALANIEIPSSITTIGWHAFYGANNLTSVTFKNTVGWRVGSISLLSAKLAKKDIAANYLNDMYYNSTWTMDATYSDFIINDGVLIKYKGRGGKVIIPNSVTTIGEMAFCDCKKLTSVKMTNNVVNIDDFAFYRSNLENIEISDSVTNIGELAFRNCLKLANVTVSENNPTYKDIDGNLYTKDGKMLIQYAIGKTDTSFIFSNSVTSISRTAFSGCKSLINIKISNSVISIGSYAFDDCSKLENVVIGDRVESIGENAFDNCQKLVNVTFKNTAGWKTDSTSFPLSSLANTSTAATYLTSTYCSDYWTRS